MWVLNVVYVVKLRVEASIIVSDDHLVFTPITGKMIIFSASFLGLYAKAISSSWLEADSSLTERQLEVTSLYPTSLNGMTSSGVPLFLGIGWLSESGHGILGRFVFVLYHHVHFILV